MAKIYTPCADHDSTVLDIASDLMQKHYQDLQRAGLTVCYLFVENGNKESLTPALTHGGYPAAATVKINSLKCRVEGKADVTVTIDRDWWTNHDREQCEALIDHELYHVLVADDDYGNFVTDDIGRPKVTLRKHDWQHGGFLEIAKRHGMKSVDMSAIAEVERVFQQASLDFGGDDRG